MPDTHSLSNYKFGLRKLFIVIVAGQVNRYETKRIIKTLSIALYVVMMVTANCSENIAAEKIQSPLRVHSDNPRYFSDSAGKVIYLTGSHTWDNFLDFGGTRANFDYDAYLKFLGENNHNFIRLWVGTPRLDVPGEVLRTQHTPWQRTGPGKANDGELKFDLTKFNEEYFLRLRSRASDAGKRGIYASIMLFNGLFDWAAHPFNIDNNVNGIKGEIDKKGGGDSINSLRDPTIVRIQENYVKKVIDTVNDLDNVLYEVGNEIKGHSVEWQYHMINFIHRYEKTKPKQHPVGMTGGGEGMRNKYLFDSPATWVSPAAEPGEYYSHNPPPATGKKVIISDTDHLAVILENPTPEWVWKSFLRGLNPILMDVIQNRVPGYDQKWNQPNRPGLAETRRAMGQTRRYANRVDLARMVPFGELTSTQYCLANPGVEYLVYLPFDDLRKREKILHRVGIMDSTIWVDLFKTSHQFRAEWFNPRTNEIKDGGTIAGGTTRHFKVPFKGDAVLYLYREPKG